MNINLSPEDYMKLRPNKLKSAFIDEVGKILSATETQDDILTAIRVAFKKLQADLETQSKDEYLLF